LSKPGSPASEIVFVVFADIADYSVMPPDEQVSIADDLKSLIRKICIDDWNSQNHLIIDVGDGAAIVYFGGSSDAIDCAVNLGTETLACGMRVRIGVHCGPVFRVKDVNGRDNVVGPGINLAERVMSCGDPGFVLLSSAAADATMAAGKWNDFIEDLGVHSVKHDVAIRLFNLVTTDCGRKGVPSRLVQHSKIIHQSAKNNLTEAERPFVGRQTEIEGLVQRIETRKDRLLTVTGPGGIGKSRLALEAAKRVGSDFIDGFWIINCDILTSEADLVAQIAAVAKLEMENLSLSSLASELADKQILFLLDCFEGMTLFGNVVEKILQHGPEIQVLVTSRSLIGLPREQEVVLNAMSLVKLGNVLSEAVTLFIEAAKAAQPDFRINRNNRAQIEAIVRRVEGIPLAIILAAGRLRHLSLHELHEQVESRPLIVLKRKSKEDDRHADISRVVDDSFRLIPEELGQLLKALSVFRGGFWLSDVEAVVPDCLDILDGVSELRDNSLLAASVEEQKMRYRTLDVVAEYLGSISEAAFLEPYQVRHAQHYCSQAQALRRHYDKGQWKEASLKLGLELGNFRRAIDCSIQTENPELTESFALALCRPLMEAGYRSDFDRLADATKDTKNLNLLIETTGLRGGISRRDKDFIGAEMSWLARADYCRLANSVEMEADTYLDLADMALIHGDTARANDYLQKFEVLEPSLPKSLILASGYVARAKAVLLEGDREGARALATRANDLAKQLTPSTHSFYVWMSLADVLNNLGEFEQSEQLCYREINHTVEGRHYYYTGTLLLKLLTSLIKQGKTELCLEVLGIAQKIPKSLSLSLRQQLTEAKKEFENVNMPRSR
jgi:predicted ATPase/class 3 adenylate cyclase